MSEQTLKQCIQDIYFDTLVFLRSQGFSQDHSRLYAFAIAKLYAETVRDLAAVGYLKERSDD